MTVRDRLARLEYLIAQIECCDPSLKSEDFRELDRLRDEQARLKRLPLDQKVETLAA